MRHLTRRALMLLSATCLCGSALADDFPSHPIRLIVPYAAGGGTDISARVIAKHLAEGLGQPVIVDNRPGAGTTLGTAIVAKAQPDGYTLVYGSVTHSIAPALYKDRMSYDAVKDFTPIAEIASFPFVLVVKPQSKIGSLAQMIEIAKAQPGKLNYASVGAGTGTNLTGEMLKMLTRTDIVHVPYNGSGPALTALLGGQVDVAIIDPPPAMPQLKAGALRALAVTTPKRSSALPDVPTMAEAGVSGFDFTSWWGVFGPAHMPQPIVERVNKELLKTLQLPDVKATLASFGADPVGSSPQDFARTVQSETERYAKVVKDAHISID